MVHCVQARLGFESAERRNVVHVALENSLTGREKWQLVVIQAGRLWEHEHGLRLEVRFTHKNDMESLAARAVSVAGAGPKGPLPGSWVRVHECPHDEARGECSAPTTVKEWV